MPADLDILRKLREEFASNVIGKKPKITCRACSKSQEKCCSEHTKTKCRQCKQFMTREHMHVDFVGHAHVTERLLDLDPEWDWEPLGRTANGLPAFDDTGGLWIKLTIGGVTRIGYGGSDGKRGDDAVKEAIGDAIKTTAMRFGVALTLWKKEQDEVVEVVEQKPAKANTKEQEEEEQRKNLRGRIAALGTSKFSWPIAQTADEFTAWTGSQKLEITRAGVAALAGFLDHISRLDPSSEPA